MKKTLFSLIAVLILLPFSAHADETTGGWKNNIELGAVLTSGNTKTLTVNAKLKSIIDGKYLRETITGSANNSTNNNKTTAETYKVSFQEDWKISERDYLFLRFSFESDRFAGFKRRFSETIGYGRDLIKTDKLLWKLELGGGLRQSQFIDLSKKNEVILRSATAFSWKISDSATLTQNLSTEGGKNGWATESITALQHALNSHLSSKISFRVEHNSKVPAMIKKTDLETAITMVVNF